MGDQDHPQLRMANIREGPHRVEIRAVDKAGNVDAHPVSVEWTVRDRPPETLLLSTPPKITCESTAAIKVHRESTPPGHESTPTPGLN
eukprot:1191426-Prorocentrum_minimum.AAC.1